MLDDISIWDVKVFLWVGYWSRQARVQVRLEGPVLGLNHSTVRSENALSVKGWILKLNLVLWSEDSAVWVAFAADTDYSPWLVAVDQFVIVPGPKVVNELS